MQLPSRKARTELYTQPNSFLPKQHFPLLAKNIQEPQKQKMQYSSTARLPQLTNWKPPTTLFAANSVLGVFEKTLREEASLITKGGLVRYTASKALSQIPFMPDRLAQRLSGLEVPMDEGARKYLKIIASKYAKLKLEEKGRVGGLADRSLRESLPKKNIHLNQVKLQAIAQRMNSNHLKYSGLIRQASLRGKFKLQSRNLVKKIQGGAQSNINREYLKRRQTTIH